MRCHDAPAPLHILIADDHAMVRAGLRRILENPGTGWTVAEAGDGMQALQCLRNQRFDLVVVDLTMPGMSGLELIRRAHAEHPGTGLLVLSMHAEPQVAMRAFKAGAGGYLTKDSAAEELVQAVRKVAAGGAYVPAHLAECMVQQMAHGGSAPAHARLSDRELDVLQRIVAGQRPAEMAAALHVSVKTISSHKTRILDKLQLPTTAALVRYGMEQGLVAGAAMPGTVERAPS